MRAEQQAMTSCMVPVTTPFWAFSASESVRLLYMKLDVGLVALLLEKEAHYGVPDGQGSGQSETSMRLPFSNTRRILH